MDFTQSMDNGYMIPSSIAVGSGEATDIRCVCDTVEDFKAFLDTTGMELRYEGLVTYEKVNKRLMVYEGNNNWKVIGEGGGDVDISNFITLTQLSQQLGNYYTKTQTDNKISEEIAKAQIGGSGEVDLSAYATKNYVDDEISKIELKEGPQGPQGLKGDKGDVGPQGPVGTVDTSNFYNKKEVDEKYKALDDKITTLSDEMEILSNKISVNLQDAIDNLISRVEILENNKPPTHIDVSSVELNKQSISCVVGDVVTLTATVLPSDATNKNITWSVNNSNCTITPNGLSCEIVGVSEGVSTVTAITQDGNKVASCTCNIEAMQEEALDIRYLRLEREDNQLVMPTNICEIDTANIGPHNDVVHPSCLYFKDGWNGYKYWMAITPYPKTVSTFENPCMIVSNDGDNWITIGDVPIHGIGEGTAHNSDCHIFMDGNTMIYLNRGATNNSSCIIEYFTSTDGVNWSERKRIIEEGEHNYLSPSVCKYQGKYYMFVYDANKTDIDDFNKRITVLESSSLNGDWNVVNTIYCPNLPSIWHLEVKIIDGGFVGLIMSGSAGGGNLYLVKFDSPFDLVVSDYIASPIIFPSGKANIEATLYKSTLVKVDNNIIELFVNSKGKGTLDAFCHWTLNRSRLIKAEIEDISNDFTIEKVVNNSEFVSINNSTHKGINVGYYNYEVEFKVSDVFNSHIALSTLNTTDYMYLGLYEKESYFAYIKGGTMHKKCNIIFKLTNNTIFRFIKDNRVCSLYADDRLIGTINEDDFKDLNPNYYKTNFGVCPSFSSNISANVDNIVQCTIKTRENETVDLDKANQELQNEILNYKENPSQYYLFDDFERDGGSLSTSVNGIAYSTDSTMPIVESNMCRIKSGGHRALVDIGETNNLTVYADLRPLMNGHLIYLKYIDINNFISCSYENNKLGIYSKINGAESLNKYVVFNKNTERYITKIDVRNNIVNVWCNNQLIISDVDISNIESNTIGFGGLLSNCKLDTFIVKK